ncbi:MAG TPA: ATP-binding protein [Terriglobales bacterium]|nr:ATP-binding protein [Terriglobales bacterium]
MRSQVFFKLVAAFVLVIAAATLTIDIAVRRSWETSLREEIQRSLQEKTLMFADRIRNAPPGADMEKIARDVSRESGARVTIIRADGLVLADSNANPNEMENHATRPEFIAALHGGVGSNSRTSHTLGVDFLYIAAPVPGGAVRLAYPLLEIAQVNHKVRMTLLGASTLAFLVALIIAALAAHSITGRLQRIVEFSGRIAEGDLTARIAEPSNDEIGKVARSLDRTARRLEESFADVERGRRELVTLLNSMQEPVIAVGADSRVIWANERMERILPGGVHRNVALVENLRDPELLATFQRAMETREVSTTRAHAVFPGRVFNVTAAPMPGGGAVGVLTDLTEIERVERTRRDFIANVSHELRTPLTSIQGYAETLQETAASDEQKEFLEVIRKNASRMARLTEDLLILARVESGEKEMRLTPTVPSELLKEAEQNFHETADNQGMQLEVSNEALRMVQADHDAIFQVFTNLIDNALKYARNGDRLQIGARDVPKGVEFFVRDFGPGISSEHLPRLFERFYRVDKARSRESGGTGLGLAIAKHIVLAHGGTIRAESELNRGSTFAFTLPAVQDGNS